MNARLSRRLAILLAVCVRLSANGDDASHCHADEVYLGQDAEAYYCKRVSFSPGWAAGSEKETVQGILRSIRNVPARQWIVTSVKFERASGPSRLPRGLSDVAAGVRPGVVVLSDPFFAADAAYQQNILIFELGKAIWFGKVNSGPREEPTVRQQQFESLFQRHGAAIGALRFASNGQNLDFLTDTNARGDLQSLFALSFRALVLELNLPAANPDPTSYSSSDWQAIRREWSGSRAEVARYLQEIMR